MAKGLANVQMRSGSQDANSPAELNILANRSTAQETHANPGWEFTIPSIVFSTTVTPVSRFTAAVASVSMTSMRCPRRNWIISSEEHLFADLLSREYPAQAANLSKYNWRASMHSVRYMLEPQTPSPRIPGFAVNTSRENLT